MTMRLIYTVSLAVLLIGCATETVPLQPAPRASSSWLLLALPSTHDFPEGQVGLPLSRWTRLEEYPSYEQCSASETKTGNQIGRQVECIASDDPALKAAD